MSDELPPDERAEMWIYRIVLEEGAISVGRLRDRVPCGRDRMRKAINSLLEQGRILRDGNGLYAPGGDALTRPDGLGGDALNRPENADLGPPHAPPPKDLKPGSNRARDDDARAPRTDLDTHVVVCAWKEIHPGSGSCHFAHQTFFRNRDAAHAHFKAHCLESHPARDWEVALVDRKTGESVYSWSSVPYEPIPYEVGKRGINAFIRDRLGM